MKGFFTNLQVDSQFRIADNPLRKADGNQNPSALPEQLRQRFCTPSDPKHLSFHNEVHRSGCVREARFASTSADCRTEGQSAVPDR
jgi:hypothetical protein